MAEKPEQLSKFSGLLISNVVFTDTELGRGADATVHAVEWNGTTCAAKRLHELLLGDHSTGGADRLLSNFERECLTWSKLRHPAVVQFIGVYFEPRSRLPVLVMEKMDTSLRRYLEDHSKEEFPLRLKVLVLRQVAQALAYLHAQKPPLVHHDLSPNNVLLNKNSFMTKVTDFGMSRAVNPSILTRKSSIKGTLAFMAPEALQDPPRYNETLDIFSFGNIILSTLTHEWPNPLPPTYLKGSKLVPRSELQRRERYCEMFTAEEKKLFTSIVRRCLENAPDKRPSSAVLVGELQRIEASISQSTPSFTPAEQHLTEEGKVQQKTQGTGLVEWFRGLTTRRGSSQPDEPKATSQGIQAKDIQTALREAKITARVLDSPHKPDYIFKVTLLGGCDPGKSCLLHRFVHNEFNKEQLVTTIRTSSAKNVEVDSKVIRTQIWDTVGQERYRIFLPLNCRFADGVMIVYDITCRYQYEEDVARQLNDVRACTSPNIVIMLVGNKCDLEHHRRVSTEEAMAYAESNSMMFIETSAMDGTNVKEAFLNLVTAIYLVKRSHGQLVNDRKPITLLVKKSHGKPDPK